MASGACGTVSPVRRGRFRLALLVAAALLAAGCGSASTPKAASVPVLITSSTPSVTTAPATTVTSTPTTTTTTETSTTPATTTATTTTSTAPATEPQTTPVPAAPAGLSAATGYGSYDDCQGTCSGAVPSSLRRPLQLPSLGAGGTCPVSAAAPTVSYAGLAIGPGPVYAAQASPLALTSFIGSAWDGGSVTWVAAPGYTGPVLIRGGELGGSGSVGFGEGLAPEDELQLLTPSTKSTGEPAGAREWSSFARVLSAGCYAYQVDGTSFSEVIVFQATG
jgi:hypothetical protein